MKRKLDVKGLLEGSVIDISEEKKSKLVFLCIIKQNTNKSWWLAKAQVFKVGNILEILTEIQSKFKLHMLKIC